MSPADIICTIIFLFWVIYEIFFEEKCNGCDECDHCSHCDHYYCEEDEDDRDEEEQIELECCSDDCEGACNNLDVAECDCWDQDFRKVDGHECGWQLCDCNRLFECDCWERDQEEIQLAREAKSEGQRNDVMATLKAQYEDRVTAENKNTQANIIWDELFEPKKQTGDGGAK